MKFKALLPIVAVIASLGAATASTAAGYNYFGTLETNLSSGNTVEVGLVRAETQGVVEIYDYYYGERDALLGTKTVQGGANGDVVVDIDAQHSGTVLAVLKVGGKEVAQQVFTFD